jgi:hypothetical protein
MIEVGTRVQFVNHYMPEDKYNKQSRRCACRNDPVEGKVFMINGKGVVFVEYVVHGVTLRIGFLLSDIGRKLKVIK